MSKTQDTKTHLCVVACRERRRHREDETPPECTWERDGEGYTCNACGLYAASGLRHFTEITAAIHHSETQAIAEGNR